MNTIKKIAIIGPESTGKSTLTVQLAKHFSTIFCVEYARDFLNENKRPYNYEDLLIISKKQLNLENNKIQLLKLEKNVKYPFLFIDSGLFVMEVWCEFVFNACYNFILESLSANLYDGIIICKPDIPWVQDGMREYPDETIRLELFEIYKTICIFENIPFTIIHGTENRLQQAIKFVAQI